MLVCVCPCSSLFFLHPGAHFVERGAALRPEPFERGVLGWPFWQSTLPEEILVVQPQFLKTSPRNTCQFQFELPGGARCHTPFGDVLHPTSRRLNHLIVRSAALINIAVTEPDGHIIN